MDHSPDALEEMVFILKNTSCPTPPPPPPTPHPSGCPGKLDYWFSIFEGETNSYGLLTLGTTSELTISRASSLNLLLYHSSSSENSTLNSVH